VSDGGSSDKTIDSLNAIKNKNFVLAKSEADKGIYDAWNKGLSSAKGRYIAFIGVDDIPGFAFIEKVLNAINSSEFSYPSLIFGNCIEHLDGLFRRVNHGKNDIENLFRRGLLTIHHQGLLHNRQLFKDSTYSLSYKLASDLEFLIRKRVDLALNTPLYIEEVQCYVEASGVSRSSGAYEIYIKDFEAIQKNLGINIAYSKKIFYVLQNFKHFPRLFNLLVKLKWIINSVNEKIVIGK
jgi:glycosyltransferase involved in cell wall biosynthesis